MEKNIKLNMSRRIRRTPFTNKVEKCGVSDFTVVNHMLLPKGFRNSVEEDYWHLNKHVQIWDVSCERQVEINGSDAKKLVNMLTPRDLWNLSLDKCLYAPLTNATGKIINDPVIVKVEEDRYWISIADSDVLLWVSGIATGLSLDVKIFEPDVSILGIQGPLSDKLMQRVFGKNFEDVKLFSVIRVPFKDTSFITARSGFSKQGGFEIYVQNTDSGLKLYDEMFKVGNEFNVKPGCPNLIERIESALLSYGNDMDNNDNPLECGFEKYVNLDSSVNFLGKDKLIKIQKNGISRKLMGLQIDTDQINMTKSLEVKNEKGEIIGDLRSACYSPHFKKVIGIAMINKPFWNASQTIEVQINEKTLKGKVCDLPFI